MSRLLVDDARVRRYLPCQVGAVRLAFDVSRLTGIHRSDLVQRNPSPEGPAGWLLEPEAPVIDLGEWLGLEPGLNSENAGRVLVFDATPDPPTGLLVGESGRARDVRHGDLQPLPPLLENLARSGFLGIWVAADHPWLVLDPLAPQTRVAGIRAETGLPSPVSDFDFSRSVPDHATPSHKGGRLLLFSTRQGEGFERPVRFGLSITQILEVASLPTLDPVPGAPAYVRGLSAWRGEPLAVVDVDRRMGWSSGKVAGDRLLVAQNVDGSRIGLVASGAPRLLRLPVPHRAVDASSMEPLALGVFELDEETVILPDLRRLAAFGGP